MINQFFRALLLLWTACAVRAESGVALKSADHDAFDQLSVIRGAEYFGQYCLGCHGLRQIRYSRIAKDLHVDESRLKEILLFGENKIHDSVQSSLSPELGQQVFGAVPPDLSLTVRSKGADWVLTYLKSFYEDPSRPLGVNNLLLPNVAMPNVLWEMQGTQRALEETHGGKSVIVGVELTKEGRLTPRQFDRALNDLVNFLTYVSEPSILARVPLGKYVIFYLLLLTWIFHRLKKEYWKDID